MRFSSPEAWAAFAAPFLIDTSKGVRSGNGLPLFGEHQREYLLCAVPVAVTAGTDFDVTLQAAEDVVVDFDRACLWVYPDADLSAGIISDPETLTRATRVLDIQFARALDVVRGVDPVVPGAEWSPFRRRTGMRLGQMLLKTGSPVTFTCIMDVQNSAPANVTGTAWLVVPCFPVRAAGHPAFMFNPDLHGRWPTHGPWQVQGSGDQAYLIAGTVQALTAETAGIVNLGALAWQGDTDGAPNRFQPELWGSQVTNIQPFGASENLLLGPAAGAFAAPAAMFAAGGLRSFDWVRFGLWGVTAGQVTNLTTALGIANGSASWAAPFSPAQSDSPALPDGCFNPCACKT